ncbi:hypothetical protein BVER_06351 [Candidatus Burkholderia verschuerenii]|uniref:N-acetyltransferase domain-containing protein n=1 Tax=Candidatus Burkholderia verschuerenii TaxID=242163 RepID=A0A0L0M8C8_9BURK|nr:GNAT family N-acetyltransferase [Candidatus Burkholderia verschuerenii]KND58598.1 hypothetical protein BVER_06351 [Candidatus Burkholderia verschuerenii]
MKQTETHVTINREDPRSLDAQGLFDEVSAMLAIFAGNAASTPFLLEEMYSARSTLLVARNRKQVPIGCGGFTRFDYGIAELKRLYSRTPGMGIARSILQKLEADALEKGYHTIVVEVSAMNRRALRFFEHNQFVPTERCGPSSVQAGRCCFEKSLNAIA